MYKGQSERDRRERTKGKEYYGALFRDERGAQGERVR